MGLKIIQEHKQKKIEKEIQFQKHQEELKHKEETQKLYEEKLKKENEKEKLKKLKNFITDYKNELISYIDYFKKYTNRQKIKKEHLNNLDKIGKIKFYLKEIFVDNFYYIEVFGVLLFYLLFIDVNPYDIFGKIITLLIIGLGLIFYKKHKNKNLSTHDIGLFKSIAIFMGIGLYITYYKLFGLRLPGINFILTELFLLLIIPIIGYFNFNSLKSKPKYIIDDDYIDKNLKEANADTNSINYIYDTWEEIIELDKKADKLIKEYKNSKKIINKNLKESNNENVKKTEIYIYKDNEIKKIKTFIKKIKNIKDIDKDISDENIILKVSDIWKEIIKIPINNFFKDVKNYEGNEKLLLKDINEMIDGYKESKDDYFLRKLIKTIFLNHNIDYIYSYLIKNKEKDIIKLTNTIKSGIFNDDSTIKVIENFLIDIEVILDDLEENKYIEDYINIIDKVQDIKEITILLFN